MKKRKAILLISLLPVVIYLCASFYQVKLPGPYYDEFIFLVDSLELSGNGGEIPLQSQFVNTRIGNHKIPLMRRSVYMGPGKTYFFAAVFSVFSPSISTVRYTTSLLGFLSLIFTFLFVRKCFNSWSAFLTILYLATDPTFVILSRNDHGPVVLMMLCKMGALFFLLKWWREEKLSTLSMGMFLLGFGLLGKANFIHFIIAILITSLILLREKLAKRLFNVKIIPAVCCFVVGAAPFIYFHITHIKDLFRIWIGGPIPGGDLQLFSVLSNIVRILRLAYSTFNGTFEQNWMLGKVSFKLWVPYLLGVSCLIYLGMIIKKNTPAIIVSKRFNFIIISSLFLFWMMVFTPHARFAWHFFIIYPFPYIFSAVVQAELFTRLWGNKSVLNRPLRIAAISLILVTVMINVRGLYIFHREIKADRVNSDWSAQIYKLADFLGRNHDKVTVCMDWGFYCNLGFLLRGESYLKDRWGDFSAADNNSFHRLRKYFNRNNYLYLFHSPQLTIFPRPLDLFKKTLKELNYRSHKAKTFCDHNGIVIYEIFRVEP